MKAHLYVETSLTLKINLLTGENSSYKSALIDSIRLLDNIGEPLRDINVSNEDFHEKVTNMRNGGYPIMAKSDQKKQK